MRSEGPTRRAGALATNPGVGLLFAGAIVKAIRDTTNRLAAAAAEILAATTQQASGAGQTSAAVAETVTTVDEVARTAEQGA